jgi:very-short-patch-repair endonuclease
MSPAAKMKPVRTAEGIRFARQLRGTMTDAESLLWYRLRAGRLDGWKFRRQVPLGIYVVDFICQSAALVIEIDGGQHAEQVRHDANRTRWLQGRGYRVLRYWNSEVLENPEGVLQAICDALPPSPRPSP